MQKEIKKMLLIQPGPFGDIFVCAPIAKWYADKGYKVYWPITKKFLSTLEHFDYIEPIIISEESLHSDWLKSDVMKIIPMIKDYDKVINLADRGPHPTAQKINENFELCKYRLAEVPFEEKNNLVWCRNIEKENRLFEKLELQKPYAVVHRVDSSGQKAEVPEINIKTVEIKEVEGYSILDWYKVFINSSEIYVVESAIHQFMDGFVGKLTPNKYILKRPAITGDFRFTVSSGWKLDYCSKIVKG